MAGMSMRWTLKGSAAAMAIVAAGCSGPIPHQTTPPPSSYSSAPPPALLGEIPAGSDHKDLAGGPVAADPRLSHGATSDPKYLARLVTFRRADGVVVTAMRPVPNPEDLSLEDRQIVYGARYAPRGFASSGRRQHLADHAAAAPVVAAALPPKFAPAPVAPPVDPKLLALQAAVGAEITAGSKLLAPERLGLGKSGQVTLSLPETLLATLQKGARKLGLTKAAKKVDISASLTGQGYEITPPGVQTTSLKLGEAPSFNWQIKPLAGPRGPLKVDLGATLRGLHLSKIMTLGELQRSILDVLPPPPPAKKSWSDYLSIPGHPTITLPGVGAVASNMVVEAILALLALFVVLNLLRGGGSDSREARRRRYRSASDAPVANAFDTDSHPHHNLAAPAAPAAVSTQADPFTIQPETHGESEIVPAPPLPAPIVAAAPLQAEAAPLSPEVEVESATTAQEANQDAATPHATPVQQVEPVAQNPAIEPSVQHLADPQVEDDYGLSQVVRDGRPEAATAEVTAPEGETPRLAGAEVDDLKPESPAPAPEHPAAEVRTLEHA